MSNTARTDNPSKRDVNALNDEESTSDRSAEKSMKREEESVPSTQAVYLQQETKNESEPELENNALKSQIDRLTREKTELQARSGMPQELASDLLDKMEKLGERYFHVSFMDLPDDVLIRFFKDLDFLSCIKLRLNKRLDGLFQCVRKEMYVIDLKISSDHYKLALGKYLCPHPRQYRDFDQLEQGLNRLSLNTTVSDIWADIDTNEHNGRIIEALSHFETDFLVVYSSNHQFILPPINLSVLRNLAQNARDVNIQCTLSSISAQDLSSLRKIMLEDRRCNLERFAMTMDGEMEKSFVKECFGVTIDEVNEPEERIRTKIYRTADESIEFYGDVFSAYVHFEEDLQTYISGRYISFCKNTGGVRDVSKKIEMNRLYSNY